MSLLKYEDFVNMSNNQLKEYLTVRGITCSGNRKVELVAKAFAAMDMQIEALAHTYNVH